MGAGWGGGCGGDFRAADLASFRLGWATDEFRTLGRVVEGRVAGGVASFVGASVRGAGVELKIGTEMGVVV